MMHASFCPFGAIINVSGGLMNTIDLNKVDFEINTIMSDIKKNVEIDIGKCSIDVATPKIDEQSLKESMDLFLKTKN